MLPPPLSALEALDVAYARFNAERSLRARDPELLVHEVGGLQVLVDASRPKDETYNRIVGLTKERLDALDEALAWFVAVPPQVDVAVDRMDPLVSGALTERGLAPAQTLVWLWGEPASLAHAPVEGVEVRRLVGEPERLLDLIGTTAPEPFSALVREKRAPHYCTDTFRAYLATVDGADAGWATLWCHEGRGILGNAYVRGPFRRRGVHRALHAARARDAAAIGLEWVVVDVLPEGASHRNALRAGMQRRTSYVWWR
ncbi:MAG: hypothetical protein R3B82_02260 [Sandaracinaceae bacterium]